MIKRFKLSLIFSILIYFAASAQNESIKPTVLSGSRNDLNAAAMSPAKFKRMAVAGWDNEVLIYNTDSPFTLVQKLIGHQAPVNCLSYNYAGNMLASGSSDQTVRLYDSMYRFEPLIEEGTNRHYSAVQSLIFDKSGKFLLTGDKDGKLLLWDVPTRKTVKSYQTNTSINDLCLSPTPANILIANAEPSIKIFGLASGKVIRTLDGHKDAVNCLALAYNNKYLISGSNDKTAIIWDLKTMKPLHILQPSCWKITSVGFSDDSKYCVTGCNDGVVNVWETETGKLISTWSSEDIGVKELCLFRNSQYILISPKLKGTQEFGARVIPSGIPNLTKVLESNKNAAPKTPMQLQLDSIIAMRTLTKQDSLKYKTLLTPPKPKTGSKNPNQLDSAIIYKTPMKKGDIKK
jgi:WD40 repeat protein